MGKRVTTWVLATDSAETASYYDTTALRALLERVIDFEWFNQSPIRFSLDAVHITTGKLRYFDSQYQRIGPEHVLASSALPPKEARVGGRIETPARHHPNPRRRKTAM